ncbi:MAG: DUF6288 domain-containing protein, partial [Phycisphaeraceae bacterium]|nr:DUF6288 domain-containing protein [Phycisphaeraceae bacterium]
PTVLQVNIDREGQLKVAGVDAGSPAEGKFENGQIITRINGRPALPEAVEEGAVFPRRAYLAQFITEAEAADGTLKFLVTPKDGGEARTVTVTIPALGRWSKTWPINCSKTDLIIRAHADYLASLAGPDGEGLTEHSLYHGHAILALLATGEAQDLDVVRKIYAARMADFDPSEIGSHNWHNGLQGIAVCEYFLRTGDRSVMPLINAICENIRKYQVQGGWSHWAKGINPQYTAGGHLNAAGAQNLTTLLLATMCGADVDRPALLDALHQFYRFVGHGSTPYGDHRPEDGYGSNNGKTEMVGLAMSVAARSTDGEVYAMARDKNVLTSLYDYPHTLQGHTGGLGAIWYGLASFWMADKRPELYRNRFDQLQWFYELSRRHNGAMGASGAARYDDPRFGHLVALGLSAPRRALQITGAPASPHAKPFTLPKQVWGRKADRAFLSIEGSAQYSGTDLVPHREMAQIAEMDEASLRSVAGHPEQAFREVAANTIRRKKHFGLIEELLESGDPILQQTACMAINLHEPWMMRFAKDGRGRFSLDARQFSPRMFRGLMTIVKDEEAALWNVDQALIALASATEAQIKSELDTILPFLEHEEWWLQEAATIALTPAMEDVDAMTRILPPLTRAMATNMHAKGRGVMQWKLRVGTENAPTPIPQMVEDAYAKAAAMTPSIPDPEPGVDLAGITSVAVTGWLQALARSPEGVLAAGRLAVLRLDDFRPRERNKVVEVLIDAAGRLDERGQRELGQLLVKHFRPDVVGDDPQTLKEEMLAGKQWRAMD